MRTRRRSFGLSLTAKPVPRTWVSDASPTATTCDVFALLARRKIAVEPRRPRGVLSATPLGETVSRTVRYDPGFVVCGPAEPLAAKTRTASEAARSSVRDLMKSG